MESPTDAEIARRVAAGGNDAAASETELCRRYINRARLYGLKHLRFDVTAAEDLAQQVMVVVLEALRGGRVDDLERIDRFMLGTCRNVAHSMRRREKRVVDTRERLSAELTSTVTPPWDFIVTRRVEECLAELNPRDARLLFLLYQEDASVAEAAEDLQTTPGNVRVLHHRAISRLQGCVSA